MAGALTDRLLLPATPPPPRNPHQDVLSHAHLTIPTSLTEGPPSRRRPSLPALLKSCADSSALSPGRQLHALSVKLRLSSDPYVQTSLLSMYSACALPDHALLLFDRMPHRTLVSWTSAAHACLRSSRPSLSLSIFIRMINSGTAPDSFSLVTALSACAHVGALNLGCSVHVLITKTCMNLTPFLATSLVDMYCKCGSVDDAVSVFSATPGKSRNVQLWNAMLHGLAMHGLGSEAVEMFSEMEADGTVRPNRVTFVALLCGCAHAGLVREGRFYFEAMKGEYGIEPTVKHYGCMVDLLGRAGLLEEALEMVRSMDVPPNHVVWGSLLSACGLHRNIGMAERVMERIVVLGEEWPPGDTSHYVIMSNIYKRAGHLTEEMARIRTMVGKKPKGRSWIEIGGYVSEFGVGADVFSHPMCADIRNMLNEVDAKLGVEMRAEDMENPHSEKLALAFGLIRSRGRTPIRISKNLRICENCHDWMKLVSKAYERDIIVRDCNRFHRLQGGLCSCKDYW